MLLEVQLGENVLDLVDYSFSENGLVAYRGQEKIGETSMRNHFSTQQMNRLVNWTLRYFADLYIPVKTGTTFLLLEETVHKKGDMNFSLMIKNMESERKCVQI